MAVLEGASICRPNIHANYAGVSAPLVANNITKVTCLHSGIWGYKTRCKSIIQVGGLSLQPCNKRQWRVNCSFSSSSDGNGSMAGNFSANDEDYVNSSVIEAVEVRSGSDGFMIKMRDGNHLRCVHNQGGNLPDYAPHPAIVLKMEDGSNLLLPIIVLEMPSVLLMAAIQNVQIARPTIFQVVKEMTEKMGYVVQLVRVTNRVNESYFAQLYLTKVGNEKETISFDLRPSDAINMAARCKDNRENPSVLCISRDCNSPRAFLTPLRPRKIRRLTSGRSSSREHVRESPNVAPVLIRSPSPVRTSSCVATDLVSEVGENSHSLLEDVSTYSLEDSGDMIPALKGIMSEIAFEITSTPPPVLIQEIPNPGTTYMPLEELHSREVDMVEAGEIKDNSAEGITHTKIILHPITENSEILKQGDAAVSEGLPSNALLTSPEMDESANVHHKDLDATLLSSDVVLVENSIQVIPLISEKIDSSTASAAGGIIHSSVAPASATYPPVLHSPGPLPSDTHAMGWMMICQLVTEFKKKILSCELLPTLNDFVGSTTLITSILGVFKFTPSVWTSFCDDILTCLSKLAEVEKELSQCDLVDQCQIDCNLVVAALSSLDVQIAEKGEVLGKEENLRQLLKLDVTN